MKCEIHNIEMERIHNFYDSNVKRWHCNKCSELHNKTEKSFRRTHEIGNYPLDKSDLEMIREKCKCRDCNKV